MPTCDICEEEAEKVYKCKKCGEEFCDDCGSASQMLCEYCREEEEYTE